MLAGMRSSRRVFASIIFGFIAVAVGSAQIRVSASQISFQIVAGGGPMSKQSLSIETAEAWTVSVSSGVFWLDLSRTEGSGNGIVTVALNSVASSQPLGARKAVIT